MKRNLIKYQCLTALAWAVCLGTFNAVAGVAFANDSAGLGSFVSPHFHPIAKRGDHVFVANTPNNTLDVIHAKSLEKVKEISIQFLGERIDEVPDLLVQRVKAVSSEIIENTKQVTLELNEIDATAFIENSSDLPFQVSTTPELARGEFRIIAEKSGFHQKILN